MGRCMEVRSLLTLDYVSLYLLVPFAPAFWGGSKPYENSLGALLQVISGSLWLAWVKRCEDSTQIRAACCQTNWAHTYITVFVAAGCKKHMDLQMLTVQSTFLPMACRCSTCSTHIKHLDLWNTGTAHASEGLISIGYWSVQATCAAVWACCMLTLHGRITIVHSIQEMIWYKTIYLYMLLQSYSYTCLYIERIKFAQTQSHRIIIDI